MPLLGILLLGIPSLGILVKHGHGWNSGHSCHWLMGILDVGYSIQEPLYSFLIALYFRF